MFKAWEPTLSIKPDEKNNMVDLEKLLDERIKSCKGIGEEMRPKAVKVIKNKSLVSVNDANEYDLMSLLVFFTCPEIKTPLLLCIIISSGPVHICQVCIDLY
jgi:hypothetical protein